LALLRVGPLLLQGRSSAKQKHLISYNYYIEKINETAQFVKAVSLTCGTIDPMSCQIYRWINGNTIIGHVVRGSIQDTMIHPSMIELGCYLFLITYIYNSIINLPCHQFRQIKLCWLTASYSSIPLTENTKLSKHSHNVVPHAHDL
jgi:hypothetical protein